MTKIEFDKADLHLIVSGLWELDRKLSDYQVELQEDFADDPEQYEFLHTRALEIQAKRNKIQELAKSIMD